ncbi:MAG: glycosyltransferase family 4 protein [Ignavibacteria bacterium]|nr:glycosyltransferase family 4 protein [Ignavibacteria bacterium]
MILYAGNILSSHGYTPTFIESLAPKLSEQYSLTAVSDKLSQPHRLMDMVRTFNRHKKELKLVLIDSYSMRAFWFTYVLARLSRRNNIPYVPILRGGGYPERLKSSPSLCRDIFGNAYRNISPSLYLKKHFTDEGYDVEYIPNFIPVNDYPFRERRSVKPKLFWVRSFHEIYNPELAADALALLKKSYPDAELCMVGPDKDGSLAPFMKKVDHLGIGGSVKITGRLSKKEWTELSQDYDIFINTTNFDNHPVSVIEAMALGMPVVSTNVGGIPYLVDDKADGTLVEPGNARVFTDAVISLLEDPDRAFAMSVNARKKVEEFDWDKVRLKWFDLIDPLVGRKAPQHVIP